MYFCGNESVSQRKQELILEELILDSEKKGYTMLPFSVCETLFSKILMTSLFIAGVPFLLFYRRGAIDEESPSYTKQPSADARAGPSRVSSEESSDSGEIQEIRKDSALYLEEAEGPNVKKIVRSRPPGIFRKARRESSGYATSVGSLDEERKGSVSSTSDAQQQQQQQDSPQSQSPSQSQSQSLKEKRRLITRIPRAEESLGEKASIGTSERMPTTEIHRKVSSAGLDMPDIEEVKEVLREETSPRSRDAETAGAGK